MTLLLLLLALLWGGYAWFGRRWRVAPLLGDVPLGAHSAPVVAIVPARNEAAELPHSLRSLLSQSYRNLRVVLIDDHSDDGTAAVARALAADLHALDRLQVLPSAALEAGWTGKVWAQRQGVAQAMQSGAEWLWFTDADIVHGPDVLARLIGRAETRQRDFVSVMARLRCQTIYEKLLIPAFTYFFAGLYPFAAVGDDDSAVAAAAGGCMLVRAGTLTRAGGIDVIRNAVIDDVALGAACKAVGARLWLGYDPDVNSTRGYDSLGALWAMVARSAYTQLGYSPGALLGSVAGLLFVFLTPIAVLLAGSGAHWLIALGIWGAMTCTYLPLVRYLGCARSWALALPLAALLYTGMTITSAWRYHRGTGNAWKGRAYDVSAADGGQAAGDRGIH